ncbi:MAG TPA: peptidylprolyl isomerase [Candidatus Saccharimonadales bacterium]|nr:peptidylprolyl isomerase [Candidatus Saccharimonadales bacterium]
MSFRNRPVLDRKHRPRWQDELRTQRLVVAGFALAVAAAIGIFGATAWIGHYDAHLRPVAEINGQTLDVDRVTARMDIISSELEAVYLDIQSQAGGLRDSIIQQELSAIQQQFSSIAATATDSLVVGRVLDGEAGKHKLSVSDAEVTTEVASRESLPERVQLSVITVPALPDNAAVGATPTDADWAKAQTDAKAIMADLKKGADFATTAKAKSSDASAQGGGLVGWIASKDTAYAAYFTEAHKAAVGTLLGPTKDDNGYHILRVDDRHAPGPNKALIDQLKSLGVSDAEYRAYIHDELMRGKFTDYFSNVVMAPYQPGREVAQIFINADQGLPVPKQRVRHFLAQPIKGGQDQSKATPAQWAAALARAQAFRAAAVKPGADWSKLAATSDDTGSASKGGDLGWYDPSSSQFVPEFEAAIAALKVGEVSQPVKTQFGYHIIQITDTRTSASGEASTLVQELRADPTRFAALAEKESEDASTASKGGEFGWVIPYQLDDPMSSAIFALKTPNQISDPIQAAAGFWIFKLIDSSPARYVPSPQLDPVRSSGFTRWLQTLRVAAHVWVDTQFTTSASGTTPGG